MDVPAPGHRVFIVTYTPLCRTAAGRDAVKTFGLPPFIDGSIRREPDLEHPLPSISCLCRAGKFAPRLRTGDHVLYLTHKGRYGDVVDRHWRLSALLQVKQVFASHEAAANAYSALGHPLPSNCMVPGNGPIPLNQSHRKTSIKGCSRVLDLWDDEYRKRANRWPIIVQCQPVFRRLDEEAPVVRDADLVFAFGHVPGTQNPGEFSISGLEKLLHRLRIDAKVEC